ncbi:glycoside hydrolase family 3 protein [Peterkaempfera bronchialis]|uniref:Exo-alpha-(1->6)-L-arabinopyranosidase n=1 Tax=Peterkaempfera bronchialis TaxID=2126346 RepID=A0A345T3I6_9ACTN|nr:glycoside hydrolase family 3 protein [Peterkaempfera bronchialis]AXI80541.1 sugar hydrolase [Peterkaempfera bronchialis]
MAAAAAAEHRDAPPADAPPADAPYRDPARPVAERVTDLLGRLTREEKVAMLHQYAPGIPRLGLAPFKTGTEALHGVSWLGEATCFPQAVGLGATWNRDLLRRIGEAVSTEVRAFHRREPPEGRARISLNVWAPVVNPLRHPLWGRNEEGYAEDPLLTAALATAYTRGLRGDHPQYWRTAPTLKHFLAYNNETDRCTTSSDLRPRVLHEYELPCYRGPVEAGAVAAVMPSYNLVNGRPNHVGSHLADHLRAWPNGAGLLVCSDAEAPSNLVAAERYFDDHAESHAAALRAGVDSFTDHGEDPSVTVRRITEALERGLATEAEVDAAVARQLTLRLRLGELDPQLDPYAGIGPEVVDCAAHRELAREAARQSVVLLRNAPRPGGGGPLLPLPPGAKLAVIGPLGDDVLRDWYSGSLPYRTTLLDALRDRLGAASVAYTDGLDRIALRSTSSGGYLTADARGLVSATADAVGAAEEFAVQDWGHGVCTLRAADGRHLTTDGYGVLAATADHPDQWVVQETFRLERGTDGRVRIQHLGSGRWIAVAAGSGALTAYAASRDQAEPFALRTVSAGAERAARLAAEADVALVVAGNDPHLNGRETEDRTDLSLPPHQEEALRAAHAANPATVLLLTSSYPYAVDWAERTLPAVLWSAHGGQEGGRALAEVLLGDHSPAGRLPQTWYRAGQRLPDLLDYDIIGSRATYLYLDEEPLHPFGHGLSYTSFGYGEARVDRAELPADPEARITVTVRVENTGDRAGDEVVQLYSRAVDSRVPTPLRRLQDFARITLRPGEAREVALTVPVRALGHWEVAHDRWTTDPGDYELLVGASSADLRSRARITLTGPAPLPRPALGTAVPARDFDDCAAVRLVDRTRERGEAVESGGGAPGVLVFRDCDLGSGAAGVTLAVSRTAPGAAAVEVHLGTPVPGAAPAAVVSVPSTGGRYAWTEVSAAAAVPGGVRDVHLVLRGALRLAELRFTP